MRKLILSNFRHFPADKTTVFFAFALPLIFIFLFGRVFGDDDISSPAYL